MGAALSAAEEPPKVVLVPPMWERDIHGRSRFLKSSYDTLFGKPALRRLFADYTHNDLLLKLRLSPASEDPRVTINAKFAVPSMNTKPGVVPSGSLTCRFEPLVAHPYTFIDVKVRSAQAQLRGCCFDPRSGLGVFTTLSQAAGGVTGMLAGLRYSSTSLGAGVAGSPIHEGMALRRAWLVTRQASGQVTAGVQYEAADSPSADGTDLDLWRHLSASVSYAPAAAYGRGAFTATFEVRQQRLLVSFLHHMVATRSVRNPLEDTSVVGITNYIDLGLQLENDLTMSEPATLQLAAAWQVNKNMLLKARLGSQSAAAAVAVKAWWQPSLTAAASYAYDFAQGRFKVGLTASIENYGNIRYDRTKEHAVTRTGAALVQRHVALPLEVANQEGKGLLVNRNTLTPEGLQGLLGQVESPSSACL
ncbi:hypothetical protein WJX72_005325 [[Myrmecia] bisecta]|uniref:Mitochondrial import receptor subunit TOM40 n=1 Tax=[Myrmecia] bisecta TaxID=41462 RepID=A0AAW1R6A0_9CHLO